MQITTATEKKEEKEEKEGLRPIFSKIMIARYIMFIGFLLMANVKEDQIAPDFLFLLLSSCALRYT